MPEVVENMDKNRLRRIRKLAIVGARSWLDLMVLADNEDADACKQQWQKIRDVSIEASDLLKALGAEKGNG